MVTKAEWAKEKRANYRKKHGRDPSPDMVESWWKSRKRLMEARKNGGGTKRKKTTNRTKRKSNPLPPVDPYGGVGRGGRGARGGRPARGTRTATGEAVADWDAWRGVWDSAETLERQTALRNAGYKSVAAAGKRYNQLSDTMKRKVNPQLQFMVEDIGPPTRGHPSRPVRPRKPSTALVNPRRADQAHYTHFIVKKSNNMILFGDDDKENLQSVIDEAEDWFGNVKPKDLRILTRATLVKRGKDPKKKSSWSRAKMNPPVQYGNRPPVFWIEDLGDVPEGHPGYGRPPPHWYPPAPPVPRYDREAGPRFTFENPGMSKKAREFISSKIKILMKEGYDQDQAIAIAYSMARKKRYKVPESPKTNIGFGGVAKTWNDLPYETREFLAERAGYERPHLIAERQWKGLRKSAKKKIKASFGEVGLASKGRGLPGSYVPPMPSFHEPPMITRGRSRGALNPKGTMRERDWEGLPIGTRSSLLKQAGYKRHRYYAPSTWDQLSDAMRRKVSLEYWGRYGHTEIAVTNPKKRNSKATPNPRVKNPCPSCGQGLRKQKKTYYSKNPKRAADGKADHARPRVVYKCSGCQKVYRNS